MSRRRGRGRSVKRSTLTLYLDESRDIGLSLLLVLPLLLAYEISMDLLGAPVRNGAELIVGRLFRDLPESTLIWGRRGVLLCLMLLALLLLWRRPPQVARARWVFVEALGFALILGPVVGWMVGGVGLSASAAASGPGWLPFLLSIGAGLWEELVFRLALLGGLALLLIRLARVPRRAAIGLAIVLSALSFALYHHVGDAGEPLQADRFAFRAVAGTILGVLFAIRGLAVVVYMHVFYDLLCDLRAVAT